MICADNGCQCAITSDSLTISGSGGQGDPWQIDTNAYTICTSVTRPGSPFTNQFIYETDMRRIRVWDGSFWRLVGGAMPTFNIQRQSVQAAVASGVATTITLPTEIEDLDGFHAGSNGFITVPVGFGGVYLMSGYSTWDANSAGYRNTVLTVGSNATPPAQTVARSGGSTMISTANNAESVSRQFTLEAGATVTLQGIQTSGGDLDVTTAGLQGVMLRHMPELV